MAFNYRVMVTGSRTWEDEFVIHHELDQIGWTCDWNLTVIHGACPSGADWHAARWCADVAKMGVIQETYPADWRSSAGFDPSAGFKRNELMVSMGADRLLAFIDPCDKLGCPERGKHGSHGAMHCLRRAERAGIHVQRWGFQ